MFCSNCGTSNSDDADFCSKCGQPLSAAPLAAPSGLALAGRGARLGAKLIDAVAFPFLIIVVVGIFFALNYVLGLLALLASLAFLIAQVVLLTRYGQTIGKKALGIRIVLVTTGQNGGFVPNVVLRAWLNFIIGLIPFYSLVDVLFIFREDRRCIHDLIAGTRVVADPPTRRP